MARRDGDRQGSALDGAGEVYFEPSEVAALRLQSPAWVSKVELGERRIDPIELQQHAALYGKALRYFLPPTKKR